MGTTLHPATSGDQVQCSDLGMHDGEMSAIDRCDVIHAQTLCCCDDGCVDGSERKVATPRHQLGDAHPVGCGNRLNDQVAGGDIAEEANLGIEAQSRAEQVDHFGDDKDRHDQRPGVGLEQLEAFNMVSVIAIDVGVQRAGVDDQCDELTSSIRISSIRSEMSARPLAPAPAPRSLRLPWGASSIVAIASRVSSDTVTPRR